MIELHIFYSKILQKLYSRNIGEKGIGAPVCRFRFHIKHFLHGGLIAVPLNLMLSFHIGSIILKYFFFILKKYLKYLSIIFKKISS